MIESVIDFFVCVFCNSLLVVQTGLQLLLLSHNVLNRCLARPLLSVDVLAAVFWNTRKAIGTEQTHSNIQKIAASPWSQPQTASY